MVPVYHSCSMNRHDIHFARPPVVRSSIKVDMTSGVRPLCIDKRIRRLNSNNTQQERRLYDVTPSVKMPWPTRTPASALKGWSTIVLVLAG